MSAPPYQSLRDVTLAISTFKTDKSVLQMLEQVFANGDNPFGSILVVDSLGSGWLGEEFKRRGWPVRYENADFNLGSAGNLALRLHLAATGTAQWCYAINHDGDLRLQNIQAMVRTGQSTNRVGAVYPTRLRPSRGNSIEAPQTKYLPLSRMAVATTRERGVREVAWASSNGALYNLEAIRQGLNVWQDLWMGWEDLAYGWLLARNGWKQLQCPDAVFVDHYEHRRIRIIGLSLYIHDKPPWMSYYTIRNLVLYVRRSKAGFVGWVVVLLRFGQEAILATLFKGAKLTRIKLLVSGLIDGLMGRTGMTILPGTGKRTAVAARKERRTCPS